METSNKPQKNGGKGKLRGAKDGVPFGIQKQPTPEAKSKGKQKKKFTRDLLKEMLNLKYKFTPDSQIKQQLIKAFGSGINNMTVAEVMTLQQQQKAILKGDTEAFKTLLNQAFGMPKQEITGEGGGPLQFATATTVIIENPHVSAKPE